MVRLEVDILRISDARWIGKLKVLQKMECYTTEGDDQHNSGVGTF